MKIVKNIRAFKVQSQIFKFSIPSDSLLNTKSEDSEEVGRHTESIVGGYFILLRSLPP